MYKSEQRYINGNLLIRNTHTRTHTFLEIGHGIISTAIISLALIQVEQLSSTGEKMCT